MLVLVFTRARIAIACALVTCAALLAGLAISPAVSLAAPAAAAPSRELSPADAAALEDAQPLDDVRVGISRTEPEYCTPDVFSEVNPNAANKNSLEVGPPKFVVEDMPAGSTWRHCVSVFNRYDVPRTVEITTLDVVGSLDPDVRVETREEPTGIGSWIRFPITRLELEPGERVLVPYLVQVAAQPPAGTNAAGIRVSDVTAQQDTGGGARITKSLIAQLQVTFPGGEARDLKVTDVESTRFIWTNRTPERVHVKFTVANEGTILDTFTPSVRVGGLFGRRVANLQGTPEVMLPSSAQSQVITWRPVPWIGIYRPELRIKSNTGTKTVQLPRVFILPPLPYVIAVGIALLLAIFGYVRRRRRWRHYVDEHWEEDEFVDGFDEG